MEPVGGVSARGWIMEVGGNAVRRTESAPSDASAGARRGLAQLQRRRKLAIALTAAVLVGVAPFVRSYGAVSGVLHDTAELVGLVLIGVAIMGRVWCTLYIGGRKANELVDTGPYSITRNPLYMFSFIGAAGIGLGSGSLLIGAVFALGAYVLFRPVVLSEEQALRALFGPPFEDYCRRVPRFLPRFSAWRETDVLVVRPATLWRTMRDGLAFLMVVPFFELVEKLQDAGVFTPYILLP